MANEKQQEQWRVQIDLSPKDYERLNKLRTETESRTNAHVVRDALRLYEWFVTQKRAGYSIRLVNDDLVKEIEILCRTTDKFF